MLGLDLFRSLGRRLSVPAVETQSFPIPAKKTYGENTSVDECA